MKLFAMLKDSLLESLDSKVIYVMLGLSVLLACIAGTMTFTPKPGAQMLMTLCAAPLSIDLEKIDRTLAGGNPMMLLAHVRGAYTVDEVAPLDGEPELPGSTFRVVLTRQESRRDPGPRPKASGLVDLVEALVQQLLNHFGPQPKTLAEVRGQFGLLDDVRLAEVVHAEEPARGKYILHARLTADGRTWWPHDFSLFFGALPITREGIPLGAQLYGWQEYLVNQVGAWVALMLSLVMTAFFIPNMLRKGTVDLLLAKPISRWVLLVYKYLGGLLFIGINTAVAVGGFWLALSLRSGIWAPGVLISIPAITFFFAILYSVSVLFGVLTRSAVVSILMSILAWAFLYAVSLTVNILDLLAYSAKMAKEKDRVNLFEGLEGLGPKGKGPRRGPPQIVSADYEEGTFAHVVRTIHFVLPRTGDLNALVSERLQRDLLAMPKVFRQALKSKPISWGESLGVSLAFIAVTLGLACWWFAKRDY